MPDAMASVDGVMTPWLAPIAWTATVAGAKLVSVNVRTQRSDGWPSTATSCVVNAGPPVTCTPKSAAVTPATGAENDAVKDSTFSCTVAPSVTELLNATETVHGAHIPPQSTSVSPAPTTSCTPLLHSGTCWTHSTGMLSSQ